MKRKAALILMVSVLGLSSCSDNQQNETEQAPTATPAAGPASNEDAASAPTTDSAQGNNTSNHSSGDNAEPENRDQQ